MAKEAPQEADQDILELVHPVYLDTPMMISFVAALEGGVAYGDERTQRKLAASDRDKEAGGRFGVPVLSSLLNLDMSGRLAAKDRQEGEEEIKVVRRHTEASLFNLLRHRLLADGQITTVDGNPSVAYLQPGQLIEVSGEVVGNPLEQLFSLMRRILPYLGLDEDELRKPRKATKQRSAGNPRSGNPAKRAQAQQVTEVKVAASEDDQEEMSLEDIVRMLFIMRDDLDDATVRDVVLTGSSDLKAVLTLSTEVLTDRTTDSLLGGRFRVLGKVTNVLQEGEIVNLTRRTALGIAGPELARALVEGFTSNSEVFVEIGDPIVEAPALQVLPLALFV